MIKIRMLCEIPNILLKYEANLLKIIKQTCLGHQHIRPHVQWRSLHCTRGEWRTIGQTIWRVDDSYLFKKIPSDKCFLALWKDSYKMERVISKKFLYNFIKCRIKKLISIFANLWWMLTLYIQVLFMTMSILTCCCSTNMLL